MSKPTYSTSDGERFTRSQIESRITKAKAEKLENQRDEFDHNFCEHPAINNLGYCGRSSGTMLDCSHDISVGTALKEGRAELAWDVNNITIRCREHHIEHDKKHHS